jgi:hypothetical protein
MTVNELIRMLGEYPANADVEIVAEGRSSTPLTREGLEIDANGETLYLGGCESGPEWD